jgi:hypothetical protein
MISDESGHERTREIMQRSTGRPLVLSLSLSLLSVLGGCGLVSSIDRSQVGDDAGADAAAAGSWLDAGAPDFSYDGGAELLRGVVVIDTSALTIDLGAGPAAPPAGATFTTTPALVASLANDAGAGVLPDGGYPSPPEIAVLTLGSLFVDKPLLVKGSRALAVVASGPIVVDQIIVTAARRRVLAEWRAEEQARVRGRCSLSST